MTWQHHILAQKHPSFLGMHQGHPQGSVRVSNLSASGVRYGV
jgi:hypothetical protein